MTKGDTKSQAAPKKSETAAEPAATSIPIKPFLVSELLYGKQVNPSQDDTVGRVEGIFIKDGKKVIPVTPEEVGSWWTNLGLVTGAFILSITKKMMGYAGTALVNIVTVEGSESDKREIHWQYRAGSRGVLASGGFATIEQITALTALHEQIFRQSVEAYPPVGPKKAGVPAAAAPQSETVQTVL